MRKMVLLLLTGLLLLSGCAHGADTDGNTAVPETTDDVPVLTTEPTPQTPSEPETQTDIAAPAETTVPPTAGTTRNMTTTTTAAATTEAPAEEAASAVGAYDFTAQYFRTNSRTEALFPQCFCVDSASALNDYIRQAEQQYSLSGSGFGESAQNYDDAWFASHTLLVAVLEEGSGSVRHTVTRVEKTAPHAGTVVIRRDVPEVGTCDMAEWHILIELPAGVFTAADNVEVVMQ